MSGRMGQRRLDVACKLYSLMVALGFGSGFFALSLQAAADQVPRPASPAGSVIERKVGEEVRFVDLPSWQEVVLHQDLVGGDILRTNATGQLAILFADHTQVRLGRNSMLQVKSMAATGDTSLSLQSGTMWARAQRGGQGLTVSTPAAAAAIRGTDWTLTVKGNETSLIVLEGKVELKNAQGSVQVAQGEAAVATLGQAPRKLVIVTPDDRQQMLFYLTLRDGFTFMPASPLPLSRMRAEHQRISSQPPASRKAEDWLTLAEVDLTLYGRDAARGALAQARRHRLGRQDMARAALIDALLAGAEKRYAAAAQLFSQARPRLDAARAGIAGYGEYYARSLADPKRVLSPPKQVAGPYAAIMKAYTSGFLEDIPAAIEVIKSAEARYPQDSTLPAVRSFLAQFINDRAQMEDAAKRSLSIDPDDVYGLVARARLRSDYQGNLDAALVDLKHAAELAPGDSMVWNDLGLVQQGRGATRSAEVALKRAIDLDPDDPIGHSNLAILYLDQSRMAEAKREIDKALSANPGFSVALLARGRYYLQTGEMDKAVEDLLAASTANPAVSQAQLMLAAAHYERGEREPAAQAIDNADRLDRNDPAISSVRTAIAIDDYDADGAIFYAQQFLRRSRAQGGRFASLEANQDAGSTLNSAFRLQGLDAWGQYYGDAVFDPFAGSSYIDQAVRGTVDPLAASYFYGGNIVTNTQNTQSFSSLIQGLLIDPHMISGRSRSANLLRRPFMEGSVGIGTTLDAGAKGIATSLELQGFSNSPVPVSGYMNLQYEQVPDDSRLFYSGTGSIPGDIDTKTLGGNAYLTATVTPDDRIVVYANKSSSLNDLTIPFRAIGFDLVYGLDNKFTTAGLGWSHTVDYQNIVNAALFYSSIDSRLDQNLALFPIDTVSNARQRNYVAAINHLYGDGTLTWRYGLEGGLIDERSTIDASLLGVTFSSDETQEKTGYGKVYVDLLQEITPELKAEYGLFATWLSGTNDHDARIDPRIGLAWSPAQGQWLRAGYIRQGTDATTPTLAPIGVVGLQPSQIGVGADGYADTFALKLDSEWTDRLFTSLEYQHQIFHDLSINDALLLSSFNSSKAEADRIAATINVAIGNGFGVSATYALAFSNDEDPNSLTFGRDLTFLPRNAAQLALTYVNDANIKTTVAANYVGQRYGDDGRERLDDYWTLDANLTWEPFDKRFALEAAAYNLLDEQFKVTPQFQGWGRVFKGMLKLRF